MGGLSSGSDINREPSRRIALAVIRAPGLGEGAIRTRSTIGVRDHQALAVERQQDEGRWAADLVVTGVPEDRGGRAAIHGRRRPPAVGQAQHGGGARERSTAQAMRSTGRAGIRVALGRLPAHPLGRSVGHERVDRRAGAGRGAAGGEQVAAKGEPAAVGEGVGGLDVAVGQGEPIVDG